MKDLNYLPKNVEFDINIQTAFPTTFGKFNNADEAQEFISKNLVAINQRITASRFLDNFEKSEIRKEYQEILESKLPYIEKDLQKANYEFTLAKENLKKCQENLNATQNEVKALAIEVKKGIREMTFDEIHTWKIPYQNQFHIVTFIQNELKVYKIVDITETEKSELFSSSEKNEIFINDNFTKEEKSE